LWQRTSFCAIELQESQVSREHALKMVVGVCSMAAIATEFLVWLTN
jgi:hypothetical protein